MIIRNIKCPKCGRRETIEIIYGMPTSEVFKKSEKGEVQLGGCVLFDGEVNPKWFCKNCKNEFGDIKKRIFNRRRTKSDNW